MKCFYWRRFRTTVSWHCLRHESFGEGEQALTHGAIDAEEHAQRSRQNIQSAPGSWYTIAHLAEVNQRANTAKHQERPQLTKFTGAWGPEDEEPDPPMVLLGVCWDASGRTKLSCKGRCRRSSNTSIPYADLDWQAIQKRTSYGNTNTISCLRMSTLAKRMSTLACGGVHMLLMVSWQQGC